MIQIQRDIIYDKFCQIMQPCIGDVKRLRFIHNDTRIQMTFSMRKVKNKKKYEGFIALWRFEVGGINNMYQSFELITTLSDLVTMISKEFETIKGIIDREAL